jgi:hypothetical protein
MEMSLLLSFPHRRISSRCPEVLVTKVQHLSCKLV